MFALNIALFHFVLFITLSSNFHLVIPAIDCGIVQTPQNGTMRGGMTIYPNLLRFDCDVGFTLYGSNSRKCQANGNWSGSEALCKGICTWNRYWNNHGHNI